MIRRSLALLALCPLFACASAPETSELPTVELDRFDYEVVVPTVSGVSEIVLTVPLPAPTSLRVLSIHGLVGNAPFHVPVTDGSDVSFANEHVSLSMAWTSHHAYTSACLQLTAPGKPVELFLRLGLPAGSAGAEEIEQSLLENTTVTAGDGQTIEAALKRFERVR